MQATSAVQPMWQPVCGRDDLVLNSGVCALLESQQVAIFALEQGQELLLYAVSNWDPIGQANVLYRGIVGSIDGEPVVASPLYKQHFSLLDGRCLEDESCRVSVFDACVQDDQVLVCTG